MNPTSFQLAAAAIFALAVLHTFSTKWFERLAHRHPRHAGIYHLLGEVEAVFGFWAMILTIVMVIMLGAPAAMEYLETRNYTEPLFVFVVMVIAATRPILQTAGKLVQLLARLLPLPRMVATYLVVLTVVPLLGSFITEPAAMTLAAMMLARELFARVNVSPLLKYATLGVLFVNVSIGGTLTSYAAPPVLMVAQAWGWDSAFMLKTFGWKAALAVTINAVLVTMVFGRQLLKLDREGSAQGDEGQQPVPLALVLTHLAFLVMVVVLAHHPVLFIGLFLFFMGVVTAYGRHQDRLILREGLLVGFFLAGLVVLGGQQQWWLKPVLTSLSSDAVFWGAMGLTAFTDNAALTYFGSLVDGLSPEFKVALVAGAVTGGGMTVIANAPNPAGVAILRRYFDHGAVNPGILALAAAIPTFVAAMAFQLP